MTKGNVFDDLGFSKEDAAALKIKAGILSALLDHIHRQRYTQKQLAELLDEYQPNISNLLNGKISTMSIEKLLNYAQRLNMEAQITMKMRPRSAKAKRPALLRALFLLSLLMPQRFSSSRQSAITSRSAFSREVFRYSMWPADDDAFHCETGSMERGTGEPISV